MNRIQTLIPSEVRRVYIHFPYCRRRCLYCDFSLTTPKNPPVKQYTESILKELLGRREMLQKPLLSLYIGGGTPSLWPPELVAEVIDELANLIGFDADCEITLECNPDDMTQTKLNAYIKAGINRFSLGVQSFDDAVLHAMKRTHSGAQAQRVLGLLAESGLCFSADLMYGLSGQKEQSFVNDLNKLLEFSPPHISCYSLTVERRTELHRWLEKGLIFLPRDEVTEQMYQYLVAHLAQEGYRHYEVSSWAKGDDIARHNSAYWEMQPYLGIGAGAHGFVRNLRVLNGDEGWSRYQNISRPSRYIAAMQSGVNCEEESEELSATEQTHWLDPSSRFSPYDYIPPVVQNVDAWIVTQPGKKTLTTPQMPAGGERFIELNMNVTENSIIITAHEELTGFVAASWRYIWEQLNDEQRQQAISRLITSVITHAKEDKSKGALTTHQNSSGETTLHFDWQTESALDFQVNTTASVALNLYPLDLQNLVVLNERKSPLLVNRYARQRVIATITLPPSMHFTQTLEPVSLQANSHRLTISATQPNSQTLVIHKNHDHDVELITPQHYVAWAQSVITASRRTRLLLPITRSTHNGL